ncbi:MAG: hypothetical protein ACRYGG_15615, partial [Janthinobacterium lividum]
AASAGMAEKLNELSDAFRGATGDSNVDRALGEIVGNAVAGAAGLATGGGSGALTAASADRFNRQLHEDDKTQGKKLAELAKQQGLPYTEADVTNQQALMNMSEGGQTYEGGVRVAVGAQPNDGTDWQPYGINQAGQQAWAQNLPASDPDLQAFIANNTNGRSAPNGMTYQATATGLNPGLVRAPDFVNFQIDYFVGSAWGTFSRDGNSFFGYGVNMALPNTVNASASVQFGWLNQATVRPGQTNNFLSGYAGNGTAAFGAVGGGIVYSPGNGTATTVGAGVGVNVGKSNNPASTGMGYTVDQGKTGIRW